MILTRYGVTVTDYGLLIGLPFQALLGGQRALRTVDAQQMGRAGDDVPDWCRQGV